MAEFDPYKHVIKLKGKDYLEVKWRLVWLRSEHPDAVITTELIQHDPGQSALFRATVVIPSGGSATGYKQESIRDFGDFLEKAETGSIGRACAALGYGTQFVVDFDEGNRIVDSPVERQPTRAAAPAPEAELEIMYLPSGEHVTYAEKKSKNGKTYYQMVSTRCERHDSPWFSWDRENWTHGAAKDNTLHVYGDDDDAQPTV